MPVPSGATRAFQLNSDSASSGTHFMYDSDRAVVILELDRGNVEKFLSHGREQVGSGAYPQIRQSTFRPASDSQWQSRRTW